MSTGPSEAPERHPQAQVQPMFIDRWSPRSFLPQPVPEATLRSLFEAARWAPRHHGEPWRLVVATERDALHRFRDVLHPDERRWADRAPVLVLVAARDGVQASFDAGAAAMALALEAHARGLAVHLVPRLDVRAARDAAAVPAGWTVVTALALGRPGPVAALPPDLAADEHPHEREPLDELVRRGRFA